MSEGGELPSGFEKVSHSKETLDVRRGDLPWLPKEELSIPLVHVRLRDKREFYLGSAIEGKRLIEAADQLDQHRSTVVNNLLYSHLPSFLSGDRKKVRTLDDRVTKRIIFCFSNPGGQRVYFMQFDNIGQLPVIIRIAVCDKATQDKVMAEISGNSQRVVKKRGKL